MARSVKSLGDLPPAVPGWARPAATATGLDAAFAAGAGLAALDAVVRRDPPWAGAWRHRLALVAAAAANARAGRREDAAALRDALCLCRPADDPGPAGRLLVAWRSLAARPAERWPEVIGGAADALGIPAAALPELVVTARQAAAGSAAAPLAAAAVAGLVLDRHSGCASLAFWLADAVLAQRLRWPVALPLLAAHMPGRARPGDDWARACCLAYARAAVQACDLSAELGRRAARLAAVAPKLRAKGAAATLQALLDDDAMTASARVAGMSDRGLRRLFERLAAHGAVQEFSGRATFRIYGL